MSLQEVALTLIKEDDFLIEETDTEVVITGTVFSLPRFSENSWSQKNLVVRAYDLSISESINLPSKDISISTRYLRILEPIILSVTGLNALPWPSSGRNGHEYGADGAPGEPGRRGNDGGNILIQAGFILGEELRLEANGGNGGEGQRGGDGGVGQNGSDAKDRTMSDPGQGRKGGDAGDGGAAGAGGKGGDGGSAGNIIVEGLGEDITETIKMIAEPGIGGAAGKAGEPGARGIGGAGGLGLACYDPDRPV
jgi:hypothetical protein